MQRGRHKTCLEHKTKKHPAPYLDDVKIVPFESIEAELLRMPLGSFGPVEEVDE